MELDVIKLKEIKPLLTGYLKESMVLLSESQVPDETTVHDVRVLMKKSRSLLKLLAPHVNGYTKRNIADLREVGRLLSSWRETSVQRKTLKVFKKKYPEVFLQLAGNKILNSILDKPAIETLPDPEKVTAIENINALLNKTSYRIRFQTMNNIDPHILLKSLEDTFLLVSDVYVTCRNTLKPETLHKFRKRIKDFLYQIYIFRALNPSKIKSIEKRLESMAQNLGKYNDIEQIIKTLDYDFKDENNLFALDELVIILREAQDAYLDKVWPSAFKIFCPGQKLVNILGFKLLVI
jgi:CHAD domain-containing protein